MRFVIGYCCLVVLAGAGRLTADDVPGGLWITPQLEVRTVIFPVDECEDFFRPDGAPAQDDDDDSCCPEVGSFPAPESCWVEHLHFPRAERPSPLAWLSKVSPVSDIEPVESNNSTWLLEAKTFTFDMAEDAKRRMCHDFQEQYCWHSLLELGLVVGIVAPLANTDADQRVRDWYQGRVHSGASIRWARPGYQFGIWQTVLPVYLGCWAGGKLCEDSFTGSIANEWAGRTLRGMLVGCPEVGALQALLGSGRPNDGEPDGSHWRPFRNNNGVSGHAFVGAMPFLTAASMTENPWLKSAFFAGSLWPAWARLDNDSHYLSQIILGWFIAYQSARSVNHTETEERRFQLSPWLDPQITGVILEVHY